MIKSFNNILNHIEEWLIAFLMAAATLLIFFAIVQRYGVTIPIPFVQDFFLNIDLSWAQELCIFMFIWMAKFGAAYGVRTGIHIGVDVFINHLKDRARKVFILIGLLAGALFTGIIGSLGARFVYEMSETGIVSADLGAPMWIVYLAIPLGSYLMCYRFLQVAWNFNRTGILPTHTYKDFNEAVNSPVLHPLDLEDKDKDKQ